MCASAVPSPSWNAALREHWRSRLTCPPSAPKPRFSRVSDRWIARASTPEPAREVLNAKEVSQLLDSLNLATPVAESSRLLVDGFLRVREDELRLPDGSAEKYLTVSGQSSRAVVVFAVTESQQLLVTLEYRHAVGSYVLSVPGGAVDAGESVLQAAERELQEETGVAVANVEVMGSCYALPGIWSQEVFFVRGKIPAYQTYGSDECGTAREGSETLMKSFFLPLSDVAACIRGVRAIDGLLVSGLTFLETS